MNLLALGLPDTVAGRRIVAASTATLLAYAVVLGLDVVGVAGANGVAAGVALAWFALALGVWLAAFARAVVRSADGDDIAVASLFFLQGSAPTAVRVRLLGLAGVALGLTIATMGVNPTGFLINMLPIGFAGLWGARHGEYPERRDHRSTNRP